MWLDIPRRLDRIEALLATLARRLETAMTNIDSDLGNLEAEESADQASTDAALAELTTLLAGELPPDKQARVDALLASMRAERAKTDAAVTPAASTAPTDTPASTV